LEAEVTDSKLQNLVVGQVIEVYFFCRFRHSLFLYRPGITVEYIANIQRADKRVPGELWPLSKVAIVAGTNRMGGGQGREICEPGEVCREKKSKVSVFW
jgi:hypothetical protein